LNLTKFEHAKDIQGLFKEQISDLQLGWKEESNDIQRPSCDISFQTSIDAFQILFENEILRIIHEETNEYI
jgi:hypothetical protein